MQIFFNGDSHTSGTELPDGTAYSNVLASMLNAEIVGNPAVGGASNYRIARTTDAYLDKCEAENKFPDLVVIGWSQVCRFDWFHDGKYRSACAGGDDLSVETMYSTNPRRAAGWEIVTKAASPESIYYLSLFHFEMIYNVHLRLEHLGIKHLFFNGCEGFRDPYRTGPAIHDTGFMMRYPDYDWGNTFWRILDKKDASLMTWASNRNYPITKWHHTSEEAHIEFANILKDYMSEHNII